jgi:hypothetical protein
MTKLQTIAFLAPLLLGCDADPAVSADHLRSSSWVDVICTFGTADRCYAKSSGSPKLMHPVVSRCHLQERVDAGELLPTTDGWFWDCDQGGKPSTFEDVLCFYDSNTSVVCYGGSRGWYAEVRPSCVPTTFTHPAWVAAGCSLDLDPSPHEYDSVMIDPLGPTWLARAVDGPDAVAVVQECAVPPGNVAAHPLSCDWVSEQPCCSCEDGLLVCVGFDYEYECPSGKSTAVMACERPSEDLSMTTTAG